MGFGELLLVLFVVLLFFGARRLPALGEGLGKAARGLKDAVKGPAAKAPPGGDEKAPEKVLPPKA